MKILLAHGVLGFGTLGPVSYFNGVARHLRETLDAVVLEPQVNPIGGIAERGRQLAAQVPAAAGERWHVLAHSMGGLDARFAIAHISGFAEKIATLVTIGTPHRGSPVADALAGEDDRLLSVIPSPIAHELRRSAALRDLTTAGAAAFDAATPDHPDVRYFYIAGDATRPNTSSSFFFQLVAKIAELHEPNDGVVTVSSASRGGRPLLQTWRGDHAGEIGWDLDVPKPWFPVPFVDRPPHLGRYESLVRLLL